MCLVFQHLNGKNWRTCVTINQTLKYQQNLFCCIEIPLCCLFLYTLTNFQVINHLLRINKFIHIHVKSLKGFIPNKSLIFRKRKNNNKKINIDDLQIYFLMSLQILILLSISRAPSSNCFFTSSPFSARISSIFLKTTEVLENELLIQTLKFINIYQ